MPDSSGIPRSEAWQRYPDDVKISLIINELDEFASIIGTNAREARRNFQWMSGLLIGALVTGLVDLASRLISR